MNSKEILFPEVNYEEWNEVFAQKDKNDKIRITTIFMYMKEKLIELTGALIEEEQ